jgi:hypothetical protein
MFLLGRDSRHWQTDIESSASRHRGVKDGAEL